ncbi:MAG: hypothetical protein EZS28_037463 [Streblomastix strix]|uniref:Uncharacterized protein n=1 Tax=Streblomastix strix TaxID=222440 RepID=A0A5J4UAT1_9EUKA|nr:MAG: hypothetical protein EZS28_037463 [Streblomastix strix]
MLTILSIQHVLEGNTIETLIDLVGMCAALLRFAERSTYIRILMMEGDQRAKQFEPGNNGFMSHAIQTLHALIIIYRHGSQDLVNPQTGQYSATAIGLGQQILRRMMFTPTQIIQQFYSGQLIPRPQIQQPFHGISQFMQNPPTLGIQQIQQSNLLTPPARSSVRHPAFQSSFKSYYSEKLNQQCNQQPTIRPSILVQQQQQSQVQEPRHVIGRLLDSPGTTLSRKIAWDKQSLWNKQSTQGIDQSPFTPVDDQELSTNMNQQQFNAHRDLLAQRSYKLGYLSLKSKGKHHRGYGQGLLNVRVFIQRRARHQYLTIND